MIRCYCKKSDYFDKKPIGDGRWWVRFSVIEKTMDDIEMIYFTEVVIKHEPTAEDIAELEAKDILERKGYKKQDAREYAGTALKFVSINGEDVWFDSEKRTSIVRSIEAERNLGQTTTKLEVNNHIYDLSIEDALDLMDKIDKYSKDCYINVINHENAIDALTVFEEVMDYDFTPGFPEKPEFTI